MSVDDIFGKLNKNTRGRLFRASDITIEKLPLASYSLTKDLGGGLARGRVATIWGAKSSAKTSMLLQTAGLYQKMGLSCAWVDAEESYDPQWAVGMGVENNDMIISESKSIDAMTADVCELISADVDFIVVDSVSGLLPSSYYEKDGSDELKEGLGGSKQIGTLSKELSNSLMKINAANSKNNSRSVVVFVSQARNAIYSWGAKPQPQGGMSLMYFSSVVIKLHSSATEKEQIKGEKLYGDKLIQVPIGRPVDYTIEYSKTSPPGLTGRYKFYYDGEDIGIDTVGELVDLSVKSGIIERGSSGWHNFDGHKVQGDVAAANYVRENVEIKNDLLKRLGINE